MFKTIGRVLGIGRARYLAGYDLNGNSFYELPSRSGSKDPRHTYRIIDWKEKRHASEYDQSLIPAQWVAWLRHTRREAPTIEELQQDAERIIRVRHNAKLIAERDAAWRASLLQAPPEDEAARADAHLVQGWPASSASARAGSSSSPAAAPIPTDAEQQQQQQQAADATTAPSSSRRRAAAAVPTAEVRSELVDSDRVQRGAEIASERRRGAVPLPTAGTGSTLGRSSDAEALVDEQARKPDLGVWEASKQRLRDRGQA
ncbi:hypothetical protein V8E36_005982 [Tilletia maclaganii]